MVTVQKVLRNCEEQGSEQLTLMKYKGCADKRKVWMIESCRQAAKRKCYTS